MPVLSLTENNMERRQGPRTPLKAKVVIRPPGVNRIISESAYLRNIGQKGFAFVLEEDLVRGGVYEFDIVTPSTHLDLKARVVHLKKQDTYYICGVKVEDLSFSQRSRFNRNIAPLVKGLQKKFLLYSLVGGILVLFVLKNLFGLSLWGSIGGGVVAGIVLYSLLPY